VNARPEPVEQQRPRLPGDSGGGQAGTHGDVRRGLPDSTRKLQLTAGGPIERKVVRFMITQMGRMPVVTAAGNDFRRRGIR
jgi:hypothetical protein